MAKQPDTKEFVAADPVDGLVAVVVTTEYRGLFFGLADPAALNGDSIALKQCRNCVYWSSDVKGFLGLVTTGPSKRCRVGPAAPEFLAKKVTAVARCTAEAIKAWEAEPWSN